MDITIKIDGTDKKFKTNFISAGMFKKAIKLSTELEDVEENMDEEFADKISCFIIEVFNKQFTLEQLYEGLDASELMPKFKECIETVMKRFGHKMQELASLNQ